MTLGEGTIINGYWRADDHELALGRLHLDEHRSHRRLHVLVRERVLHASWTKERDRLWQTRIGKLQVARLQLAVTTQQA